jgi:hypothetical protein
VSRASFRSWFALAGLLLSLLAAVISMIEGDSVELAFFVLLTIAAATQAWLVRRPDIGWMRRAAQGIAVGWVIGAIWIGVLLLMYQNASRPPPAAEERYLGLTATIYHLVAVYGGALLATIAAFGPGRLLDQRTGR